MLNAILLNTFNYKVFCLPLAANIFQYYVRALISVLVVSVCLHYPIQSKEDQTQVVTNLKTISMSSSKLLLAAKALSADPSAPNLKNQLAAAAR